MNRQKLKAKVVEQGYTLRSLAKELGMSGNALYRKTNGKVEFRLSEVEGICDKLGIQSAEEVREIFFA